MVEVPVAGRGRAFSFKPRGNVLCHRHARENRRQTIGNRAGRRALRLEAAVGAPIPMAPSGWRNMPAEDATGWAPEDDFRCIAAWHP